MKAIAAGSPRPLLTKHRIVAHMEDRLSRGRGCWPLCGWCCRVDGVAVGEAVRAFAGFATLGHAHIRGLGTPRPLFVARPLSKVERARPKGGCSAPARVNHRGRIHARPPIAHRGRLPLPLRARGRRTPRASSTRPCTRDHQHLLESPTATQRALASTQRRPPQTRRDRRRRDRPRARRLLLGDRDLPHHQS